MIHPQKSRYILLWTRKFYKRFWKTLKKKTAKTIVSGIQSAVTKFIKINSYANDDNKHRKNVNRFIQYILLYITIHFRTARVIIHTTQVYVRLGTNNNYLIGKNTHLLISKCAFLPILARKPYHRVNFSATKYTSNIVYSRNCFA